MRKIIQTLIIVLALLSGCGVATMVDDAAMINMSTPSPEPTATSMPVPTATPKQTETSTPKPTPSSEPMAMPSLEPTTSTLVASVTPSPEPTATSTPTPTPTNTPMPSPTTKLEYAIVPNIVGMAWEEAVDTLVAAGLRPNGIISSEFNDTIPEFHVASQSIEPGTQLMCGTYVDYIVSLGTMSSLLPTNTPTPTPTVIFDLNRALAAMATPTPTPMPIYPLYTEFSDANIVNEHYRDSERDKFTGSFQGTYTLYADGTIVGDYGYDWIIVFYTDGTTIEYSRGGNIYTTYANGIEMIKFSEKNSGNTSIDYPDGTEILIQDGIRYVYKYDESGHFKIKEKVEKDGTVVTYICDEGGRSLSCSWIEMYPHWYEKYGIFVYLLHEQDFINETGCLRIVNADGSFNQWSETIYDKKIVGRGSDEIRLYKHDGTGVHIPIQELVLSGYGQENGQLIYNFLIEN